MLWKPLLVASMSWHYHKGICLFQFWCLFFPGTVCRHLTEPQNGTVHVHSYYSHGTAEFGCNTGYELTSTDYLVCSLMAVWIGTIPKCEGILPSSGEFCSWALGSGWSYWHDLINAGIGFLADCISKVQQFDSILSYLYQPNGLHKRLLSLQSFL